MAHISEKMLQAYVSSRLPVKEERAIMEHIAMCDSCAHRFAASMEKGILISPPPDLKQEILKKTVNKEASISVAEKVSERICRQKRELLAYSMRVVFAMAASLMILFTMSVQDDAGRMPEEIVQTQEKTRFVLAKNDVVKRKALEKDLEAEERKKNSEKEEKKKLTDSLQEAAGVFGDTLAGFWEQLWK